MARTLIPTVTSAYQSSTTLSVNATAVAPDIVDGMYFVNPKNQTVVLYVVNNTAATSTNITITSIVDEAGRGNSSCNNIDAFAIAADTSYVFGPFESNWWNQPNGVVWVDFSATDAAILVLAVQIA